MDRQIPEISFKPLSEGLGFHPFSDGLPYAPSVKQQRPAAPAPARILNTQPVSKTIQPVPPQKPVVAAQPAPIVAPQPTESVSVEARKWYLMRRVMAYGFDWLSCGGFFAGVLSAFLWESESFYRLLLNPSVFIVTILFFIAFNWLLITFQEVVFKTSLGKKLFKLGFQASGSALLLRAFLFVLSAGFFGLGLFWALVDRKKRCWHDIGLGIQPVEQI